jgi:probable F420-dependent oxidoreductase
MATLLRMKFGIAYFPTDLGTPMTELAPAVEERGFESLWVAEHSHIPTTTTGPVPGSGPLPKQYSHTLDPFLALTAAAVATRTLKLGTGICLVIQHDPIDLAKSVATIDNLSNGRFLFGVGGGWNRPEIEDHGTPFERRWRVMRERIEAMKQIWANDVAEYHGEFVDFGPMWQWPKPVQKPHPPIHVGGNGPRTLDRVLRYADGWMPNRGDFMSRISELRRMAEEAGRGPVEITTYIPPQGGAADIERYAQAGVDRVLCYVPAEGRDAALKALDDVTELVRPYRERD